MTVKEVELTEAIIGQLIALSEDWEKENSCHGYRKNTPENIRGNRVFLSIDDDSIVGYLLGHNVVAEKTTSVYPAGTVCFEIEELYVKPECRNRGIGKMLFQCAEKAVSADMILLSTATKNFRAILHFYIDELEMEFWSARLFKKIR